MIYLAEKGSSDVVLFVPSGVLMEVCAICETKVDETRVFSEERGDGVEVASATGDQHRFDLRCLFFVLMPFRTLSDGIG